MSDVEFKPSDKAREIFRALAKSEKDLAIEAFFRMWEAEDDPRRAGSMAAHVHVTNGARVAVFGAMCAGVDPQKELWMAVCAQAFDEAIKDVSDAFDQAADESQPLTSAQSTDAT